MLFGIKAYGKCFDHKGGALMKGIKLVHLYRTLENSLTPSSIEGHSIKEGCL